MPQQDTQSVVDDLFGIGRPAPARAALVTSAHLNPDREVEHQRTARQIGVPTSFVRDNPDEAVRLAAQQRAAATAEDIRQRAPRTSHWLASASNAAIAHDDVGVLARIEGWVVGALSAFDRWDRADARRPVGGLGAVGAYVGALALGDPAATRRTPGIVRRVPKALAAFGGSAVEGLAGAVETTQRAAERFDVTAELQRRVFGGTIEDAVGGAAERLADRGDAFARRVRPVTGDYVTDQVLAGVENAPFTALALGTGLAGRAAGLSERAATLLGTATGGVVQGGQSGHRALAQDVNPLGALAYAGVDAATEIAGEYLGEREFLRGSEIGRTVLERFLRSQVGEQIGEQFTTVAQDLSAWAVLPENKDKTLNDFLAQLPDHMLATAIQTAVGGGIASATIGAIERIADSPAARLRSTRAARAFELHAALGDLMHQAAASKLRGRSAESFSQFIERVTENTSLTHIFANPQLTFEALNRQ